MECEYCDTEHPENQIANPHYCIARLMERNEYCEDKISELERLTTCPICAGTGKPTSEKECACGGSGTIGDAFQTLLNEYHKLVSENESLKSLMDGDTDWYAIAKKAEEEIEKLKHIHSQHKANMAEMAKLMAEDRIKELEAELKLEQTCNRVGEAVIRENEALTKENMRLMGLLSGAASLRKDAE